MTFDTFDQSDEQTWPDRKNTYLLTYLPTYLPTHPPTSLTEHPQGAILETCDFWDIWSEWWRDMTWPKKYLPTYILTHLPTYPPTYLPNRTPSRSNPGDLWPLRHLIRVMRRHDLTEKIPTYQHTIPTHLPSSPPPRKLVHLKVKKFSMFILHFRLFWAF